VEESVRKITLTAVAIIASLLVTSCAGVLTFRNPKAPKAVIGAGAAKAAAPVKFEDFENGTLVGSYGYGNTGGGASVKYVIGDPSADKAHSGQYCAKAVFDTGLNGDWGCGFGSQSSYGSGYIDASGHESITFWVNAPEGTTFYCFINESGANGADGEFYNGPDMTGAGKWTEYTVMFDELHKNIYSGSQMGNNQFDPSGVGTVGFQLGGNQGKGNFLVDDIWFK
jgi:hypothetical protein